MRALLSTVLPALLLTALPAGDPPVFQPAEGAKLETTWTIEASVELVDLSLSMGGQVMGPEEMGLPGDLSAEGHVEMRWLDHFVKMDGSRPLELVRTVREMHAEGESSTGDSGEDDSEKIVDKPVRFTWNADEERYERAWVDQEGEDNDLRHMAVDADVRGLLPQGPVEIGQSWEVRGRPLLRLLVPLYALEDLADEEELFDGEEVPRELLESFSGMADDVVVTCTWRGAAEADGRTLGRIDLELTMDQSLDIDPSMFGQEMPDEMDVDPITFSVDATMSGFLDWDLASGHMAAIELSGSGSMNASMSMSHAQGFDMSGEAEASFELSIKGSTLKE